MFDMATPAGSKSCHNINRLTCPTLPFRRLDSIGENRLLPNPCEPAEGTA